MTASRSASVVPTITSRVEDALRVADDFVPTATLLAKLNVKPSQLNAALWWLQKVGAVEAVTDSSGALHWFATPSTDRRSRVVEERKLEDEPRRARRGRTRDAARVEPKKEG